MNTLIPYVHSRFNNKCNRPTQRRHTDAVTGFSLFLQTRIRRPNYGATNTTPGVTKISLPKIYTADLIYLMCSQSKITAGVYKAVRYSITDIQVLFFLTIYFVDEIIRA